METKDLLDVISGSETVSWEGALFALKINSIDYMPSRLCNIAEEHGLKVIGLFVNEKETGKMIIYLKVNSLEVKHFATSLKARGFGIEYCSVNFQNEEEIKDNYKALMDYLDL